MNAKKTAPITIKDLLLNPALINLFFLPPPLCGCGCGEPLVLVPGETEFMNGRRVRADCYFGALGEEIERHPIGPGRRVRSACA